MDTFSFPTEWYLLKPPQLHSIFKGEELHEEKIFVEPEHSFSYRRFGYSQDYKTSTMGS